MCLIKYRGNCTINFKSLIKEFTHRSELKQEKLIKEPIIQEVEKYILVEPKSKYNKKERLKAELQQIILNLMENENHRKTIMKVSHQL
jgi:hypothetical protein